MTIAPVLTAAFSDRSNVPDAVSDLIQADNGVNW